MDFSNRFKVKRLNVVLLKNFKIASLMLSWTVFGIVSANPFKQGFSFRFNPLFWVGPDFYESFYPATGQ